MRIIRFVNLSIGRHGYAGTHPTANKIEKKADLLLGEREDMMIASDHRQYNCYRIILIQHGIGQCDSQFKYSMREDQVPEIDEAECN